MDENIEARIEKIEFRNQKVEGDKRWETSSVRVFSVCVITYFCAAGTLYLIGATNVLLSALVPVLGFYLSTQSLPLIRKWWERRNEKR